MWRPWLKRSRCQAASESRLAEALGFTLNPSRRRPMVDDLDDKRLERLTGLLEAALELVTQQNAPTNLPEISRLCRAAADLAQEAQPLPAEQVRLS